MKTIVLDKKNAKKFNALYYGSTDRFDDPNIICLGTIDNTVFPARAAGILVASIVENSVNIEWLYVHPDYRRKGIATGLLDQMMLAADKAQIDDVFCTFSEANDSVTFFTLDFGFAICFTTGWHDYDLKLKDFKPLPKDPTGEFELESFFYTSQKDIDAFNAMVAESDATVGVPLTIDPRDYSPMSVCVKKNGKITGILLVQINQMEDTTKIEFPWVFFKSDSIKAMPAVYGLVIDSIRELYPESTKVHFETLNPGMDGIVTKLAPSAEFKEVYSAHWEMG